MYKKKPNSKGGSSSNKIDPKSSKMEINDILKEIQFLGSSNMTWKERKELENRRVVSLGGKPSKKHRIPLNVARVTMKKQKEREQKLLQERLVLGQFGGNSVDTNRVAEKRRADDRVLKSSDGRFQGGVLDVKHLLQPASSKHDETHAHGNAKGKKNKGSGKKGRGKKRGGKKRH